MLCLLTVLAANRVSSRSLTQAMDGCIVRCGIISSCRSAATCPEIVQRFWSQRSLTCARGAIASNGLFASLPIGSVLFKKLYLGRRRRSKSEVGSKQREWHVAEWEFVDKVEYVIAESVRSAARCWCRASQVSALCSQSPWLRHQYTDTGRCRTFPPHVPPGRFSLPILLHEDRER